MSPAARIEAATTITTRALAHDHGGHLAGFRRQFPDAPEPLIDLSTGINPIPYPVPHLPDSVWTRLPEPEDVLALEAEAAETYGVSDPAMVVAAPGTQILISLLPYLLSAEPATVLGPTYGEHARAWRLSGRAVREVSDFEALPTSGVVVVGQPNNPDGRVWPRDRLISLADRLAGQAGLLVVDEAFADFEPDASVTAALPHPGLLIWRSFGKAYGLPGVRLGFALGSPPLAARLRDALGPWAVSGPALAIGTPALRDREWSRAAAARLARDGGRLDALLTPHGVVSGTRLFRRLITPHASPLFIQLGARGIAVRRFVRSPSWLRFGLPAQEPEWSRLAAALKAPLA